MKKVVDWNQHQRYQLRVTRSQPQTKMNIESIKSAASNGNNGYADFPAISNDIKAQLAIAGFTVQPSSSLYFGGVRVYSPKAIRAGRIA